MAQRRRRRRAPTQVARRSRLRRAIWTRGRRTRPKSPASARPDLHAPDRRGRPSPLLLHLAAAAASAGQAVALAPLAHDPRFPWRPDFAAQGARAGRALAETGAHGPLAAAAEAAKRLKDMITGIERWQTHPHVRRLPDPPALWRAGAARLLDYRPEGGPAVLVVPSLVNRAQVLDLHLQRSLLRWLAAKGLRPLLLDWGDPGPEERGFDLSAYWRDRLIPAARAARAAAGPLATLGYCMGGAFAAALAQHRPDLCRRLVLIGAPWDFARLDGFGAALAQLAARGDPAGAAARIEALGRAFGAVPTDALQLAFALIDPTLAQRKFRRFAHLPEGLDAELFVATEDWLNHGPPLAAPSARDLTLHWYAENRPVRGLWRLDGAPVGPAAIRVPVLAFCSRTDRIAPPACAEPLPRAIPGARIQRPAAGHVGMIVGGRARTEVWTPLAEFLSEDGT